LCLGCGGAALASAALRANRLPRLLKNVTPATDSIAIDSDVIKARGGKAEAKASSIRAKAKAKAWSHKAKVSRGTRPRSQVLSPRPRPGVTKPRPKF